MKTTFEKRVEYERLENGVDLYLLKTLVKDVVMAHIAIPGGRLAVPKEIIPHLLADLMPFGTGKEKKTAVLEKLELLGAQLSVSFSDMYLEVRLVSRKAVFAEAFSLVFSTIANPLFEDREWNITRERMATSLKHQKEDTGIQAFIALQKTLFAKGHPHWGQDIPALDRELASTAKHEVEEAYKNILTGSGAMLCIMGDVSQKDITPSLRRLILTLKQEVRADTYPKYNIEKLQQKSERHHIVPIRDKVNVDTLFGIPLFITPVHSDYLALTVAVHILGMSNTSRLFNILRTRENLTYGSSAFLAGFSTRFPGYLKGTAIFPQDVFLKGRKSLEQVVHMFCEKGITKKELQEHQEEIVGSYAVRLSTTAGVCGALMQVVRNGRPVSFLDEYPALIDGLAHREVQNAIQTHIDFTLLKTAAAGSIDKDGKPI